MSKKAVAPKYLIGAAYFAHGNATYDSRIENFTWSIAAAGIASKRLLVGVGL